ncbi:MAG: TetR/AcrR family transcriptional regulator [Ilumatobacteraceae bacterium]
MSDPPHPTARPYHHGDLQCALKAAAVDLITERGAAGFSLREVARRAGVSHAAPAHHFGDSRGLLTAIAVDAFEMLARDVGTARDAHDDPAEQVVAMGRAYVRTGMNHPAHAAVVFRHDLVNSDYPRYQQAGLIAYRQLEDVMTVLRGRSEPDSETIDATRLAWAAMQGLVTLYPNMHGLAEFTGEALGSPDEMSERFSRLLLAGLRHP